MKDKIKIPTPSDNNPVTNQINDLFDQETMKNLSDLIMNSKHDLKNLKNSYSNQSVKSEEESEGEGEKEENECAICYETTKEGMVKLKCGHYFHEECILGWMKNVPKRGEKFLSNNARCPLCRSFILTKEENDGKINELCKPVKKNWDMMVDILLKSENEDLVAIDDQQKQKIRSLSSSNSNSNTKSNSKTKSTRKEVMKILKDFVFFLCYDCGNIYFGGMKNCGRDINNNNNDDDDDDKNLPESKKDHLCVDCVNKRLNNDFETSCKKHGKAFIAFKCRYCCRTANWFCFGTTHFCEPCHKVCNYKVYKCPGPPECSGNHRENGKTKKSEQCLGCVLCRNHY